MFRVTDAVPLVALELSATVWLPEEQVGRSTAPAGLPVTAQLSETVPAYPLEELTVMVEVAGAPGVAVTAVPASE